LTTPHRRPMRTCGNVLSIGSVRSMKVGRPNEDSVTGDRPPSLTTWGSWRKSWTKWRVIGPAPGLQKRPLEGRARLRVVPVLSQEAGRVETLPLHAALVRTPEGLGWHHHRRPQGHSSTETKPHRVVGARVAGLVDS